MAGRKSAHQPYKAQEPDDNFRDYATETEWKYYCAWKKLGTYDAAAKECGVARSAARHAIGRMFQRAAQQGYAPKFDLTHKVPHGLTLKGTSIRYEKKGAVDQYWNKTKPQGRDPDEVVRLADPKKISKVATLFDQQGQVTQQWVSEKPEDAQKEALWRVFAEELSAKLERVAPVELIPTSHLSGDLCALLPVGDHHFGLLAWGEETGSDGYDLKIAEQLLVDATNYLLSATPPCQTALIAFLGDLLHIDSFEAVTPTNKNLLDADGRFPKMVRAAIRTMRYMIMAALSRHEHVHVIIEIGNHDLSSSIFLMECLANIYENEPRITIDTSPSHYHYFEFGQVLVGTHHGHGPKLEQLPNIMASDRPEAWGRTRHRYWLTGHIHRKTAMDFPGVTVESFRVLPPIDAYAAQSGYRSIRSMHAIMLHKEHGEVGRHTVNPDMFKTE